MKKFMLAALAAGAVLSAVPPAVAADGCGRGYHRGPRGVCRPNWRGERVVVAPGLVIGNYYHGRGYWDGHRYWHNRYRWHRGWRYR